MPMAIVRGPKVALHKFGTFEKVLVLDAGRAALCIAINSTLCVQIAKDESMVRIREGGP